MTQLVMLDGISLFCPVNRLEHVWPQMDAQDERKGKKLKFSVRIYEAMNNSNAMPHAQAGRTI